jgi:hypothetical protein
MLSNRDTIRRNTLDELIIGPDEHGITLVFTPATHKGGMVLDVASKGPKGSILAAHQISMKGCAKIAEYLKTFSDKFGGSEESK